MLHDIRQVSSDASQLPTKHVLLVFEREVIIFTYLLIHVMFVSKLHIDMGLVHTGSQVLSPKYDIDAYMTTLFGSEAWDLC